VNIDLVFHNFGRINLFFLFDSVIDKLVTFGLLWSML